MKNYNYAKDMESYFVFEAISQKMRDLFSRTKIPYIRESIKKRFHSHYVKYPSSKWIVRRLPN